MTVTELGRTGQEKGGAAVLGSSTLVLFGATGDLARRKLVPALYALAAAGLLPRGFNLIGTSRERLDDDEFRCRCADWVRHHAHPEPDGDALAELLSRFRFLPGDFADPSLYGELSGRLQQLERTLDAPACRLFYLSTSPELFSPIVEALGASELHRRGDPSTRVLIEKPFGRSADEARAFNRVLHSVFAEEQVYRVDHYLGKEEVQNILALRFANSIIENFWDRSTIASVQITAAEEVGIGRRAGYYESAGALRDHLQNHMLQLLCMIAMEPPVDLSAAAVRDQKVRVLGPVAPPASDAAVRGQYTAGLVGGERVPGYREEEGVAPDSRIETFAALRLAVMTPRWEGVPFYLRTGKRLARHETEIAIFLRPSSHPAFLEATEPDPTADQLLIGLRPNDGVRLSLVTKVPGTGMRMRPAPTRLADAGGGPAGGAYERLLLDALRGDPTLFTRADETEGQWRICDPILRCWQTEDEGGVEIPLYPAGSQGPDGVARLLAAGHRWRPI